MKAAIYRRYGGPEVVQPEEVATPVLRANEVLIEVHAASVNPVDVHLMMGKPVALRLGTGIAKPRTGRLGVDVAGVVASVGAKVTRFSVGDEVFGWSRGSFADHASAPEGWLTLKPSTLSFEEAASLPVAGAMALQGLRNIAELMPGETVLVNGAGGGIGSFAVQIARALGADVIGVCSTPKMGLVRSLGARDVIDYTKEDFTVSGDEVDVILDLAGSHSFRAYREILRKGGRVVVGGHAAAGYSETPLDFLRGLFGVFLATVMSRFGSKKFKPYLQRPSVPDLDLLAQFVIRGDMKPVIDVRAGLASVQDAIADVANGHAAGKIVITIA